MDKKIKNVIFDFGGVLIDWNPRYLYRGYFDTEEEMEHFLQNVCTDEWNAQQDAGRPFAEGLALLKTKFPKYTEPIDLYYSRWNEMIGGEIKENVDWLRALKADGYKVYGLTNWSAETLPRVMSRYDFFRLFDGIVVSGEEHLVKPDLRIFQLLLDRYHLDPAECLFVDDTAQNIESAERLGMATKRILKKE